MPTPEDMLHDVLTFNVAGSELPLPPSHEKARQPTLHDHAPGMVPDVVSTNPRAVRAVGCMWGVNPFPGTTGAKHRSSLLNLD